MTHRQLYIDTLTLYPVADRFPTVDCDVTKLTVKALPKELDTTVSLHLNGESVADFLVAADSAADKATSRSLPVEFTVRPGDSLTCAITGELPTVTTLPVTKYPTAPYPNWQTWQVGGAIPVWFCIGTQVIITAAANPAVVVSGTVSAWDTTTKKFRIELGKIEGDVTPYNSWTLALDAGKVADVVSVSATYQYAKRIPTWRAAAEEAEDVNVVSAPILPPIRRPRKHRIMM